MIALATATWPTGLLFWLVFAWIGVAVAVIAAIAYRGFQHRRHTNS
jgi:hypothetical protein